MKNVHRANLRRRSLLHLAANVFGVTDNAIFVHERAPSEVWDFNRWNGSGFPCSGSKPHRFPDNLLGLVSEDPLGRAVPADDSAVEVLADNCVVGRLNDGCEALRTNLSKIGRASCRERV